LLTRIFHSHGNQIGRVFSCKGINIVVDYFFKRGHQNIKALVPRFRRGNSDQDCPTIHPEILDVLDARGFLTYTPSRYVNNRLILPYDDRFILKAAVYYNAVIVSNDNYKDLWQEDPSWKRQVETRCVLTLYIPIPILCIIRFNILEHFIN
jgi:ribonuclease ZC3H12